MSINLEKNKEFVKLPMIYKEDIDLYSLLVYVVLRSFNNKLNPYESKVGLIGLSKKTGLSKNFVKSKLEQLREKEMIDYTSERNKTTIYHINKDFDDKFKMISFDLINDTSLEPREKALLIGISYYITHKEDEFHCILSPRELSKEFGVSKKTITDIQRSLKEKGYLREERFSGYSDRLWIYSLPILFIPNDTIITPNKQIIDLERKYDELREEVKVLKDIVTTFVNFA